MTRQFEIRPSRCTSITCDRCHKKYDDLFEMQEFLSVKTRCGYGNTAFGDMTMIELDLCQHCTREVLGEWIRVSTHLRDEELMGILRDDSEVFDW